MEEDRRSFLRLASLAALCVAGKGSLPGFDETAEASTSQASKGVRRAMVIDLRKCLETKDCKACTEACHRVHNVPTMSDPKHEVKWIWQEPFHDVFPDENSPYVDEALTAGPALVFCNHCDDPPCARVCPTEATWKRSDGVVMMDWHRCIGCRYCMAACPYGSRSFNWEDPRPHLTQLNRDFPTRTKGVVEKCTFCDERLDRGELPACVVACKEKAMTFGDLNDPDSEVRRLLRSRFALRRKPSLGTQPQIYYLV